MNSGKIIVRLQSLRGDLRGYAELPIETQHDTLLIFGGEIYERVTHIGAYEECFQIARSLRTFEVRGPLLTQRERDERRGLSLDDEDDG